MSRPKSPKRGIIEAELKLDPTQSDRAISVKSGLSATTVGKIRKELVEKREIPKVDVRRTVNGRKRQVPGTSINDQPEAEPEAETQAEPAPKPPTRTSELTTSSKFSDEEIRGALELLAMCSGNALRASRLTEERGKRVSPTTLRDWARDTHSKWYEELRGRIEPLVYAHHAEGYEDLVGRFQDIQKQAAERLEEQLPGASTNETSTIAYRASVAAGVATDKASAIRGRPSQITEHKQAEDILEGMRRKGYVIEAEAEEIDVEKRLPEAEDEKGDEDHQEDGT